MTDLDGVEESGLAHQHILQLRFRLMKRRAAIPDAVDPYRSFNFAAVTWLPPGADVQISGSPADAPADCEKYALPVNLVRIGCNREVMDDDELIARLADGDDVALRELFSRHAPWLAARLRAVLPAPDVEDVLQETFLAAWRSAATYAPQGAAGGWL